MDHAARILGAGVIRKIDKNFLFQGFGAEEDFGTGFTEWITPLAFLVLATLFAAQDTRVFQPEILRARLRRGLVVQ